MKKSWKTKLKVSSLAKTSFARAVALVFVLLLPLFGISQPPWSSCGGSGAYQSNSPLGINICPSGSYQIDCKGDVRWWDAGGSNDYVEIARPHAENGISLIQGTGERADLRFDGTLLKLVTNNGSTYPGNDYGITINNDGFVGMGATPSTRYRLTVNDNRASNYGSWINANSVGPALWVRKDDAGNYVAGSNSGLNYAFAAENTSSASNNGGGYFTGIDFGIYTEASAAVSTNPLGVNSYVHGPSSGSPATTAVAIKGDAIWSNNSTGVIAIGNSEETSGTSQYAYGVDASALIVSHTFDNHSSTAYGLSGIAEGAYYNFGLFGKINAGAGVSNYGYSVYGTTGSLGGCGGSGPYWAGYFAGDVYTTTNYWASDEQFKENIEPLSNSLAIINKLNAKTFTYKNNDEFKSFNFRSGKQYGLIAQELEQVLPILVTNARNPEITDKNGKTISKALDFKAVNYIGLISILIGGIQEQETKITSLEKRILEVENFLSKNGINMNQLNKNGNIILDQNSPNPITEDASISYTIPVESGISSATIYIYDLSGKQIKKYDLLNLNGKGSITLKSGDLQAGIYLYTLMCDNNLIDTKRMIIKN